MIKFFEKLFRGKDSRIAEQKQPSVQLSSYNAPTVDMKLKEIPAQNTSSQKIYVSYATNVGKVRGENEDNYFVDSVGIRILENESGERTLDGSYPRIFAVCDGMGGEAYGEEASRITADVLREAARLLGEASAEELDDLIHQVVTKANDRIVEMRRERRCGISGSTLAMVCLREGQAYAYNIGDSKVYCLEDGVLVQVNEDQTVAARKVKANIYTEEEARKSSDFSKLTSFVGVDDRGIGIKALTYAPICMTNRVLVLCSDGLSDMCEKEEIVGVLSAVSGNKAEALVRRALERGGEDNVTCIVIECSDEDIKE